jgi:hypothetical protein
MEAARIEPAWFVDSKDLIESTQQHKAHDPRIAENLGTQ